MAQPLNDSGSKARRRPPKAASGREDRRLLEAFRGRDEEACRAFLLANYGAMVRVARGYVGSRAVAEEVVQEAWVAMFRGLETFEGRSSLRTWLFGILIQRARAIGVRERRSAAVSQLVDDHADDSADPTERFFHGEGRPDAGSWAMPPARWRHDPEAEALGAEMRSWLSEAINGLPEMQRLVVGLRDVEGWNTAEIARVLEKTRNWVRVTLHRGRFRVRAAIEKKQQAQE